MRFDTEGLRPGSAAIPLLIVALAGCGGSDTTEDAGAFDASRADAAQVDAGESDSGSVDASRVDAGTIDGGTTTDCTAPIPDLDLEPIAGSATFSDPVQVVQPPGSTDLYVVERGGTIRIVRTATVLPTPFIDIAEIGTPTSDSEWGLLSLAFHPDYATNGRFFVGYTHQRGGAWKNVIGEGRRSEANPDVADATLVDVLVVNDFASNHNGGLVMFGPDGRLYAGFGDGGGADDPNLNGQDLAEVLGKIVRVDVSGAAGTFTVPADNPFLGTAGANGAIWAYGVRNPWRFSFDRDTGDFWVGDVGQDGFEEIDFAAAATSAGQNYGWSYYEGDADHHFVTGSTLNETSPHHPPLVDYPHSLGASVVGGYVYRGAAIPALRGAYLYGDSYGGWVRGLRQCAGSITAGPTAIPSLDVGETRYGDAALVSFGEDNAGELYVVYLTGGVRRIVAR